MTSSTSPMSTSAPAGTDRPLVVGIGGSAGAVTALQHFFEAVPEEPGLAFVVVMHLAPEKTSELAEVLQPHSSLPVTQVTGATPIEENHIYVTAPGRTLLLEGTSLVPYELEGQEERRFPIDQFFRSLARAPVEPMGTVLSGAGTDGSVGLRVIKEAGGLIAAQDPSEAGHSSMPQSAIEASRVDLVLPVAELARRLSEQPRVLDHLPFLEKPEALLREEENSLEEILKDIFEEVRTRTGHDFRQYKRSTMLRRIQRRLQVHQISSLSEYLSFLKEHPGEATALLKDFLISVTSFFRDPEAFAALREHVVPNILDDRAPNNQVRAWAVGCATGEEAYSLAMLFLEQAASANVVPEQIQIFATDLDEEALASARKGRYPEAVAADIPERYLERFFRRDGAEYVVRKEVRDRVLFTTHDLLTDPPFSKVDLISCRNLLIYLQRDLQETVFDLFSYALNEEGYLFLGSSESADLAEKHFRTHLKSHRLYRRREGTHVVPELPSGPLAPRVPQGTEAEVLDGNGSAQNRSVEDPSATSSTAVTFSDRTSSEAAVHRRLLEAYAPPSAVVDKTHKFVHLSQGAGRYLHHPGGTPNDNLVELVRPELKMKLRSALREAFDEGSVVHSQPTSVQFNGESHPVRLIVRPARDARKGAGLALVVFDELEEAPETTSETDGTEKNTSSDAHVARLEADLKQTKEELRATIAEHEASKQEMQAANEELRSMNEEYRSTAEELETSKEELQSVNEELKSVNRELEEKVQQLERANADLESLMAATDIGTLFLDEELCIQRYTPRIEELFNIREADEGRPVGDLTHHLDYNRLVDDAQHVLEDESPMEREAQSDAGEWFMVRHHPHRTADGDVDGVVITFVDITRRKGAEQDLRSANESLKKRTQQVQNLTEALTTAELEERKRLSEVLHDSLQQLLFAAQMKLGNMERNLSGEQLEKAESIRELIEDGIETARTLSRELNPPAGKESLQDTFEWLAVQMQESYGLSVDLKTRGTAKTTDKSLQSLLFRLVRELLFNAVKHAEVEKAFLFLIEGDDRLRVVVEDEGKGFNLSVLEEEEGGGHGLVSVRDRIEMIGGRFDVESDPGKGTQFTIEVPWQNDGHGGGEGGDLSLDPYR